MRSGVPLRLRHFFTSDKPHFLTGRLNMNFPAILLPPTPLTISLIVSAATILLAICLLGRRRNARLLLAGCTGLAIFFLTIPAASAVDRVIINGTGCQVTEEDAVGIYLNQDLYLRIDYPNTHWRLRLAQHG